MTIERPNFLIIVADDLGFSDVGCFGSEITTPNIDSLAASGGPMSDFHTAAACSPTRAMLLSGTDNHIAGVGVISEHKGYNLRRWDVPGHEGYLNYRIAALPELLQDAGYHTLLSGKWHLGLKPDYLPHKRGFDRSFALLPGCANHYAYEPQFQYDMISFFERIPPLYAEGSKRVDLKANTTNDPDGFFSSNFYATNLIKYPPERPTDQPFFAFLPFAAPHWPLQVDKSYRDKYRCLIPLDVVPHDVVAPEESEWSLLTEYEKKLSARAMETYAGMVENMDWNIGRVIEHLRSAGDLDNTFVLFMSDNGTEGAAYEAAPVLGPSLMSVVRKHYDNALDNIGEHDSFVWYGPRWAQAATAPSRLYKMHSTEGGIRVSLILNFPAWHNHEHKRIVDAFATVMDIAPTVLELAGVPHPEKHTTFRGRNSRPCHVNTIHDADAPPVGWEWKIVHMPTAAHGKGAWELYDLSADPGETIDLAESETGRLTQLVALWDTYVRETGVVWGEALVPGVVDVEPRDTIGGDPSEDTRAWMPESRGRAKSKV